MPIRRKQIRETVERLLKNNGVTDGPVPVEKIVRTIGIHIKLDSVDENLSGFLYRERESGTAIIGANKSHHPNRRRFTIAHELGHFILHEGELVHLDEEPASYTVDFRDQRSSRGEDDNEKEANLFAAELLMPAHFLRNELQGKRLDLLQDEHQGFLQKLAKKYKVSMQALTIRLSYLQYVNS